MEKYIICIHTNPTLTTFNYYMVTNEEENLLCNGKIGKIGFGNSWLTFYSQEGKLIVDKQANIYNHRDSISTIFGLLADNGFKDPDAIVMKIAHGGPKNDKHKIIDDDLIDELKNLIVFAPEKLPPQIETIRELCKMKADIPKVACFDTSFYIKMPHISRNFPIPKELWHNGVRKYGFDSLTMEQVLHKLPKIKKRKTLIFNLSSNSSSVVALKDGEVIDTVAGFTPMGGLMIDTYPGDLDPGILLYLMKEHNMNPSQIEHFIGSQSGLLGISKISADLETLIKQRYDNEDADLAVNMFIYAAKKSIGSLIAALGGVDNIVFTGSIGSESSTIRWEICRDLEFLGIDINSFENNKNSKVISTHKSSCWVYVLKIEECAMAARHAYEILFS